MAVHVRCGRRRTTRYSGHAAAGAAGISQERVMKRLGLAVIAAAVLTLLQTSPARAACFTHDGQAGPARFSLGPAPAFAATPAGSSDTSIVGLWKTTFLVGAGPDIWDQAFE